ncbi:MAG: NAD(P)H-dependent oxidoreductase [Candidatus Methanoplasma sp.]|jgi:multimeric flavodoxin WrbA|nr:NAD(P)H-dependent oxidoreductase [Candidatus Methanoplasma sp.]
MGKVVSIISSNRAKGNSDTIVNKIMTGAMCLTTNTFSLHYLCKMHARGCMACMECKKTGKCAMGDDLSKVLEDIRTADSLIVSTPLYFDQKSWAYRMFEDRMFSFIDGNGVSTLPPGKELIIVVTYSDNYDEAAAVAGHIEAIMVGIFKCDLIGTIIYCDHGRQDSAANDDDVCDIACKYGASLSIAEPFSTNIVSIPGDDARRGTDRIPQG